MIHFYSCMTVHGTEGLCLLLTLSNSCHCIACVYLIQLVVDVYELFDKIVPPWNGSYTKMCNEKNSNRSIWSKKYGTYTVSFGNRITLFIFRFHWTDRLTEWQTDKSDCLTPSHMHAWGNYEKGFASATQILHTTCSHSPNNASQLPSTFQYFED